MKITLPQITPGDWRLIHNPDGAPEIVWELSNMRICKVVPYPRSLLKSDTPDERTMEECTVEGDANAKAITALPKLLQALATLIPVVEIYSGDRNPGSVRDEQIRAAYEALTAAGATIEP